VPGAGTVRSRHEVIGVSGPLVTFRTTFEFAADGQVLTSRSTLRFREREEIEGDLARNGFTVKDVRDAPDRPGREFVFVAERVAAPPSNLHGDIRCTTEPALNSR
jgi:hypothetical protein